MDASSQEASKAHSLLLRSPGDVVGPGGRVVLVNQLLDNLAGVIELVKVLLEHVFLAELLQEGFALAQFVILLAGAFKELDKEEKYRQVHGQQAGREATHWQDKDAAGCFSQATLGEEAR